MWPGQVGGRKGERKRERNVVRAGILVNPEEGVHTVHTCVHLVGVCDHGQSSCRHVYNII